MTSRYLETFLWQVPNPTYTLHHNPTCKYARDMTFTQHSDIAGYHLALNPQ
jgi:hypothetical protein